MEAFGTRQIVGRVGLSQHIRKTTQSQSVFCFNQMSGQFKLISVLLYLLLWITSLGNCQTWEGCTERVIMDNCFKSSADRQWRCFCLHEKYPWATWHYANSVCASTYYYYHGALATDNSSYIHDILQRLVANTSQEEVWIGARTRPLYWNWMATQENRHAKPISYQGCYTTSVVDEEKREIFGGNLRGQCYTRCVLKRFNYFALEKDERWISRPPWRKDVWFCSCGHQFNSGTVDQSCEECDPSGEGGHGWCGIKGEGKAVYSIHALGLFNKWGRDEPKGINDVRCLLYDTYTRYREEWKSLPCYWLNDPELCVRDGLYCNFPDKQGMLSGKCFRVQQGSAVTQRQAAEACQDQNMSLVSASNYSIHEDAIDIWIQEGKHDINFWTSGTNLRWIWITDKEVGINGQYLGWADKEEFAFENMCIAFTSSGIWSSQSCYEYKAFICETVVGDHEVIPRQTTLSAAITKSSKPAVQETTTSTRNTTATTRETMASTRQTTASPQETGTTVSSIPPGGQGSDSGRQVALTAGATVAGIICLLVLLAFTIFLIRRKRKVQKATSEQPSTFVHNHFPLNNLRSNGAVSSNVTTKGAYENVTFQKEPEYYNVPAAPMKDQRNSRSNMSRNEQREKQTESRTNESASNADLADGIKRDNVEMMENDLYYSSSLPESSTYTTDNTQETAKSHNAKLSPVNSSHDTTKEGKTSKESGHEYYNFPKAPKNIGNVGVCMTDMVDNDIYVPSEESGPVTESVPNMIDNDIYETAEDDVNELGKGKTQQSKPQIPYPKPQEMQHSHLQAATGHYELASPVTQIGNQGQEAEVVEHGVGNDLYANVNKPKPKQHTTQEK